MTQQYKNQYNMDWERIQEWQKYSFQKDMLKPIWLLLMVTTAYLGTLAIIQNEQGLGMVYVFLFSYALYQAFFRKRMNLKRQYERSVKQQGHPTWQRTITIGEGIHVEDGNMVLDYSFQNLHKVMEKGDYIFLSFRNGMGIRLLKSAFVEGDAESFLVFIREQIK